MNGVPVAAVPSVNDPERLKRLDAAIRQRKKARLRPFYFVIFTLGAWWLLAVLADIVITCTPGGPPCRAPQIFDSIGRLMNRDRWAEFSQAGATAALSKYEWPLLLLALLGRAVGGQGGGVPGHGCHGRVQRSRTRRKVQRRRTRRNNVA